MTKEQSCSRRSNPARELKKQLQLIKMSTRVPELNNVVDKATPFVKEYYAILKDEWTRKITDGWTPYRLTTLLENKELKQLNKQYKLLLKTDE